MCTVLYYNRDGEQIKQAPGNPCEPEPFVQNSSMKAIDVMGTYEEPEPLTLSWNDLHATVSLVSNTQLEKVKQFT